VERLLEDGDGALLVAEADGRVVGAIVAGWDGWRGNMYRLAVLPYEPLSLTLSVRHTN
jgi:hypothetical protein